MNEMAAELEYLMVGLPISANTPKAAEWAIKQIVQLTQERDEARAAKAYTSKNTVDELMAKLLARVGDLSEMRIAIFGFGVKLRDYALTESEVVRLGEDIIKLSGVCENCRGTGEDGDPPEANGEGGSMFLCQRCDGTGFSTANAEAHGRRSRTVQPLVGSLDSE